MSTPVVASIVAFVVLLLLHEPPAVALLSVVELPRHTDNEPENVAGVVPTVTVTFLRQPLASV